MTSDEREYRNHGREDGHRPRGRSDDRSREDRGYRPRNDRGQRDGRRSEGYRPRDDRRSGRDGGYRPRDDRRSRDEEERPRLTIPDDVVKILHKGVDCEVNGRTDLAQILYLHGAARLNGGSENNLLRMLREVDSEQFPTIRGTLRKESPEDIMPVSDYLCGTIDSTYDTSGIRESAESGNIIAIHCLIRMGQLDKDDPMVDVYAKGIRENPDLVTRGLDLLARRAGSEKAARYLADYKEYVRVKGTIRNVFARAMKGEASARKELDRLAGLYPEAKFLEGYIATFEAGTGEDYLRKGMRSDAPLILSYIPELRLRDSPFSKYLQAKRLQYKGEQWIPAMVAAVKEGSDEAMDELYEVQNRRDVRKSLESYYLAKGDVEGMVLGYDGRDSTCLDKYCNGELERILEVGRLLGGTREVEWLSRCHRNGCQECREALIRMASDERRHGKHLLYALHDCDADMEAARLYFEMLDDPSVPSVKWLAKVCRNEEAKEYVRSRFEAMNDLETFDYIFEDDGYVPKYKMNRGRSQGRRRY
ncbi:MAG: hypothetical protein MJZ38_02420 [archaeon]|nr:hypothetical protein [archaeon]